MSNSAPQNVSAPGTAPPESSQRVLRVTAICLVALVVCGVGRWAGRGLMSALRPRVRPAPRAGRAATFVPADMNGPLEVGEGADAPDVPRPPAAKRRFCQRGSRDRALMFQYESVESPEAVAAHYRATMPDHGWREAQRASALASREYPGILLFFRKKRGRQCIIGVSESADPVRTMTTVMVR